MLNLISVGDLIRVSEEGVSSLVAVVEKRNDLISVLAPESEGGLKHFLHDCISNCEIVLKAEDAIRKHSPFSSTSRVKSNFGRGVIIAALDGFAALRLIPDGVIAIRPVAEFSLHCE